MRSKAASGRQALHTEASASLPRFFYAGDPADMRVAAEATIHSHVTWQRQVGRNVFALVRGQNATFDLKQEEVVILAAPLDSFGEVPRQSPGARGAANCAALLELGRHFKAAPPRTSF